MNRPAGAEALCAGHGKAFGHDSLAGERRVAVNKQRQHTRARIVVVQLLLFRPRLAEHDRIDGFKMRRVGRERQMHAAIIELAVRRRTEMIFHIARAFDVVRIGAAAVEFMEDLPVGLRHDIDEYVEPPAMRHAEHDLLHAELSAAFDDLLERRDHRFAAVESEALGSDEAERGEFLEGFRFDQLVED